LRIRRATPSIGAMHYKRHAAWFIAALVFAACLLPLLVYYTGEFTLGPYARGGPWRFVGDYYADLLHLRGSAWVLLLGPVALVAFWRVLVEAAWPRAGD
jgi:hypothetical protein